MGESDHPDARPRLVTALQAALAEHAVVLVEAGPGYGKTTLLGSLAGARPWATVNWSPTRPHARPHVEELCALIAGSNHPPPGGTPPDDGAAAVLAAFAARRDPVLLVIDDAHRLTGGAARAIGRALVRLTPPHRAVLASRGDCPGLERLREHRAVARIGAADLAMTPDEVAALVPDRTGDDWERRLREVADATGGWPRGVTRLLAVPGGETARAGPPGLAAAQLDGLLRELADAMPEEVRAAMAAVLALPRIAPALAETVSERPGVLSELLDAGLPLSPGASRWWTAPGFLRRSLGGTALEWQAGRRAAARYAGEGELAAAVQCLVAVGEGGDLAALLAVAPGAAVDRLGARALAGLSVMISDEAVLVYPRALLRLLRAEELAGRSVRPTQLEHRLDRLLGRHPETSAGGCVAAEGARRLLDLGRTDEARSAAIELVAEPRDPMVRARALEVLARAAARDGGAGGLVAAERLLSEAAMLWRALDEPGWAAQTALRLARVDAAAGRWERAVQRVAAVALTVQPGAPVWGVATRLRAELLIERGMREIASAALDDLERRIREPAHAPTRARVAWLRARIAAQDGDAAAVHRWLGAAAAESGAWEAGYLGLRFWADAADLSARVGAVDDAERALQRARAHPANPRLPVVLAEGLVAARQGDPAAALARLDALLTGGALAPRDRWRVALLAGWAATRAGATGIERYVATAADEAARIEQSWAPAVAEPIVAARLLDATVSVAGVKGGERR